MINRASCFAPLLIALAIVLQGCESVPTAPPSPPPAETPVAPPAPPPAPEPAPPVEPAPVEELQPAPVERVEVEVPEPTPPQPVVCVPPKPAKPAAPERPKSVLPILGGVENILIEPPGVQLAARLNTGAASSVLDARNIRVFERDGSQWVRFQVADRKAPAPSEVSRPVVRTVATKGDAASKRYVVKIRTRLGEIDQFVEFTLDDRSSSRYPVLLGRDFLRDQALVDVARRFTLTPARP